MYQSTCGKTCWCCINYCSHHCRYHLHICIITNNVGKPPIDHTCKIDCTTLELWKLDEQIIFRALNTQETPDIIITHYYKGKIILF